jgi:hypothetical protein
MGTGLPALTLELRSEGGREVRRGLAWAGNLEAARSQPGTSPRGVSPAEVREAVLGTRRRLEREGQARAVVEPTPVDGYWLTLRSEKKLSELARFEQTAVSGRGVLSRYGQTTSANELEVRGAFTVTQRTPPVAGTGLRLSAHVSVLVTIRAVSNLATGEVQVLNRRMVFNATLAFEGDELLGSVVVDVFDPQRRDSSRPVARVERVWRSEPNRVTYQLSSTDEDDNGEVRFTPFARLSLRENPDVAREDNPFHQKAEAALDVVQAALVSYWTGCSSIVVAPRCAPP